MMAWIGWTVLAAVVGWGVQPLTYQFFRFLPDRGFNFSKILGLLLWGFVFWMSASLQLVNNSLASMLAALFLLIAISYIRICRKGWLEYKTWLIDHRRMILISELVFILSFGFWALFRAFYPALDGTEKPMEMAFINSILHSPTFPPADPWLSGYSISYYYFGYVMVSMLIKVSGVSAGIGFNLAVALWFGLTAIGAYGILFNLLTRFRKENEPGLEQKKPYLVSLLAPFFILMVSNIEGLLESLHSKGIFWTPSADGSWTSQFWLWLGIQEINQPPAPPFQWAPERIAGIWWWRASRVLQDRNALGELKEVIDEFPFFSFFLADLHPHVLAIPFALLMIAVAFNLWMQLNNGWTGFEKPTFRDWLFQRPSEGSVRFLDTRLVARFRKGYFWIPVITLGGLAFLNTWDLPVYVVLLVMVWIYADYKQNGWRNELIADFVGLSIVYALLSVLFYFPFYWGFSSQAGGILPGMVYSTRGIHFWVMFAPFLVPLLIFLFWYVRQSSGATARVAAGLKVAVLFLTSLLTLSFMLGGLILQLKTWGNQIIAVTSSPVLQALAQKMIQGGDLFAAVQGTADINRLWSISLIRRINAPGTWITLGLIITLVWAGLIQYRKADQEAAQNSKTDAETSRFVLFLILIGAVLTLGLEFFYLRDQFGVRMNTVFKFYYQTWILWALAAAYGIVALAACVKGWKKVLTQGLMLLGIAAGLVYPGWALAGRVSVSALKNLNLDGNIHRQKYQPDVWQAIQWLENAPAGTVVEAVGNSYSEYARFATYSGHPNVIGWPGHESQWRGPEYAQFGNRPGDVQRIYQSQNWIEVEHLLELYSVRYVVVSDLERSAYQITESVFEKHLPLVFQNNAVAIYEVP